MPKQNAQSQDPNHRVELDLLANGVDFILHAIDELFDEDHVLRGFSLPTDVSDKGYKYGFLHLFSGFLLLLKERLFRHEPELVFRGTVPEVKQKLAQGKKLNTVNLREALERLEGGPKVVFSELEMRTIREVQELRNDFEHFKVHADKSQLWTVLMSFLDIVEKFLVDELQINIETTADSYELLRKLDTIEAVGKRILAEQERKWQIDMDRKFAEFSESRTEALEDLHYRPWIEKDSLDIFIECPDCDQVSLIAIGEYAGICIDPECNGTTRVVECARCGVKIGGGSLRDLVFCSSCEEDMERE